jgi:hypothetical protein
MESYTAMPAKNLIVLKSKQSFVTVRAEALREWARETRAIYHPKPLILINFRHLGL